MGVLSTQYVPLARLEAVARTRVSLGLGLIRFARGLRGFLREPITPEQASAAIRSRVARRDDAFLDLVERAVFAAPRSPYRRLFRAAGCEPGDLGALVRREGLEAALERLHRAGVYVSFDEFKGRRPIVRGSEVFHVHETDFDNPLVTPHYAAPSGGSRGRATRILIDLEYLADRAPLWCLWFAEHGLLRSPLVFFTPYYPGAVNLQLICAKFGQRFVRWFATARGGSVAYRLASGYLHCLVRRQARVPRAEFVTPGDAGAVAEYLVGLVRAGTPPCVNAAPSAAIRLGQAATEHGLTLEGVTFLLGYEPLTGARREAIEATGARAVMTYGFSEGGTLGQQCRWPCAPDDVHIASDVFAVIRAEGAGAGEGSGAPLLLTGLQPTAPKIMLNAAIGDAGILETRSCQCEFEAMGYTHHLHTIRSWHKLTGEGVTFLGPDVVHVLEEVLPRRFGGLPTDYQLVEEEDAEGLPRYRLLVSPDVGPLEEPTVVRDFLRELARLRPHYRFMVEQWAQAARLVVERQRPVPTGQAKVLPIRTLRSR